MKKVSVLLFAVVSFILMISPAANAALVYDSGQLPIGKWHVHLSKHTFNADAAKNGVLSISRQAPGLAIHVGFVILNRRLIPLKRFLNGPDVTFQKKVRLKQRNRLRVFLIGSPGAAVGITIHTPAENQPPPTAALHAAPETIVAGAACTLTWSSEYADTCTIEPGIGRVDTGGSMTVSPAATTAYTLTASGSGGTVSSSVTVTVNPPVPTVTLSAVPTYITRGESAVLTWTTSNADACVITPSVGDVAPNGSVTVAPTETTAYAVTASGAGGTATDSMAIVVIQPVPTVNITASPDSIHAGDSATLTWSSTHAESCVIEPDIGYAAPSGSVDVSPTETTTYTITATGFGGNSTRSVTVTIIPPISIQIDAPVDGELINRPDTMVRGTVVNATGRETGITVNGAVAMVVGNQFVTNHVPLQEGSNTITVTASDVNGNSQTVSMLLNAAIPAHHVELSSDIESGSSALEANLNIDGTFSIADSVVLHSGPGPVALVKANPKEYSVSLTEEGIHYFTAEVIHETATYSDTIAVVVVNAAEIDALLQQKWVRMKSRLGSGDIAGALDHFSDGTRPLFEYNFNLLNNHLNEIIAGMQSITLVKIEEGRAEYNLVGEQAGQSFSFYLLFQQSGDGIWRIVNF